MSFLDIFALSSIYEYHRIPNRAITLNPFTVPEKDFSPKWDFPLSTHFIGIPAKYKFLLPQNLLPLDLLIEKGGGSLGQVG
jgi:hypothetical protein